ncbi:hypothetical protein DFH27DRAFT_536015 [Peziza echinospora]|nr:hypothetical protein DFH27DRAFT_536015 [Peziza echinospora]
MKKLLDYKCKFGKPPPNVNTVSCGFFMWDEDAKEFEITLQKAIIDARKVRWTEWGVSPIREREQISHTHSTRAQTRSFTAAPLAGVNQAEPGRAYARPPQPTPRPKTLKRPPPLSNSASKRTKHRGDDSDEDDTASSLVSASSPGSWTKAGGRSDDGSDTSEDEFTRIGREDMETEIIENENKPNSTNVSRSNRNNPSEASSHNVTPRKPVLSTATEDDNIFNTSAKNVSGRGLFSNAKHTTDAPIRYPSILKTPASNRHNGSFMTSSGCTFSHFATPSTIRRLNMSFTGSSVPQTPCSASRNQCEARCVSSVLTHDVFSLLKANDCLVSLELEIRLKALLETYSNKESGYLLGRERTREHLALAREKIESLENEKKALKNELRALQEENARSRSERKQEMNHTVNRTLRGKVQEMKLGQEEAEDQLP